MSRQSLTRQALYDAVWAEPMSRLAPTYGVTGTGLKKVCDRHDIPTPDRGYWALGERIGDAWKAGKKHGT